VGAGRDARAMKGQRYQMKSKLMSIGDDSWIDNDQGQHVYKVNGKAMRLRDTFVLEDPDGHELAKIKEKMLTVRNAVKIEREGDTIATVHKAMLGIRDRFDIDLEHGHDLKAKGNFIDHEYEIKRDRHVVAKISKKWFRLRETYGIEIAEGEDEPLLLSVAVAVDKLTSGPAD
jgi:uncharacterized protein YxjI